MGWGAGLFAVGASPLVAGGAHFRSATNPVATDDQLAAEAQAIRLWAREDVQAARRKVGFLFKLAYGADAPAAMAPRFEAAMDEFVFNYLLKACASDADHPRFVRCFMAAYQWFGRDVPGARMGGDNPDNCYRLAGISHQGRYRLHVVAAGVEPASTTFTLVANWGTSKTVQTLDAVQAVRGADGGFEILIDADPADGRPNHLRTTPETLFLFVRDSFADWARETPYALRIERLDAPASAPIDDDEAARRAVAAVVEDVPLYYWFTRLNTGKPVNTLASPIPSGALGGLVNQAGTQGWCRLEPGQAMAIRLKPAGASYCALSLVDWWYRSLDAERVVSSLTNRQAVLDADGTMTLVIAAEDPGVANWVDTGGEREVLVIARWQGLPAAPVGAGPQVLEARLTHVAEVRDRPEAFGAIALAARTAQRQARQAAYARRYRV
jgi:hypothetical protein